jgi:RNA ligase (TIGR02306 family)
MSTFEIKVVKIDEVIPHSNADRLELVRIAGWNCVVRKGEFKAGDVVIYIPIDSILPFDLESTLFPPDSKVKLSKSRVKTIKLRGAISQGIVVRPDEVFPFPQQQRVSLGDNVAERLGITKYEPPVRDIPARLKGNQVPKKGINPHFKKYTDIENFKYYPNLFEVGEQVYISEKAHGTSARYSWLPEEPNTGWKKIKAFFRKLFSVPQPYEFCIGSRNVQLQDKSKYDGFYSENVYGKIADQYDLRNKIPYGVGVYGEIVGAGIQKGYTYGCGEGEHKFFVYDIKREDAYLDYDRFKMWAGVMGLQTVPELYVGPFDPVFVDSLRSGDSLIGDQKVREGIVIKPAVEQTSMIGRKVLKYINDEYLLKDQTDFH